MTFMGASWLRRMTLRSRCSRFLGNAGAGTSGLGVLWGSPAVQPTFPNSADAAQSQGRAAFPVLFQLS